MSDLPPLGRLFREHRQLNRISWKRLSKAVGLEPETMMLWERGVTRDPPIAKALLYAREVGISLEELAEAALGQPWDQAGTPDAESTNGAKPSPGDRLAAIRESADAASSKDEQRVSKTRRSRKSSR